MGGLAFASGPNPLSTPRMPFAVYEVVKSRCHEILKQYYTYVATPIEAPGKKDYGDVDFLVACPTPLCHGPNIAVILGKALGTEHSISGKGSNTISFALPWPKEIDSETTTSDQGPGNDNADCFVQVDVNVCHGEEEWEWMLFHHAHGDLWNILGSTIRKLGLTVNNVGLYLRIEDIELIDRKKSMILLTKKPSEVLSFLALDEEQWWHQFESAQAMYDYAAGCRYFWADDEFKEIEEDKKALKHNDRKRMNLRPVFRKWVEEFIPECRASGKNDRRPPSREQVRADAFERFGVKDEYEQRLIVWRRERQMDEVWRDVIKGGLPTEDVDFELRAAAIRGLKAIIIEGELIDSITPPKPLKNADGFYDMDAVVEFVRDSWQHVGAIQLEKQKTRAAENMEQKRNAKMQQLAESRVSA
jgi:hypothetical protein